MSKNNLRRFVIVGDNHGDEVNVELEAIFFDWLADYAPHIAIHSGDNWNFAALRRKATPEEKQQSLAPDVEDGKDFINRLFAKAQRKFFTRGNHDERIFSLAREAKDAAVSMLAGKLTHEIAELLRNHGATWKPYDSRLGVLDVDGIRVIHGYAAGVGAARRFGAIYGTCAFGHTHSMDIAPVEKYPEVSVAHGTGCLCRIDQPYNSPQPGKLRHENGWLYGHTDGQRATYFQARYKDGKVYAAQTIKEY